MHAIHRQTETLLVLEDPIPKDHPFRAYVRIIDIPGLAMPLDALYSDQDRRETGAERDLLFIL